MPLNRSEGGTVELLARAEESAAQARADRTAQAQTGLEEKKQTTAERLRSRLLTTPQLSELPPPEWHIDGLVPDTGFTLLYGPAGSGKSFAAMSMAMSLATGVDFLGHAVKKPARTLYVVGEGARGMSSRVDAWKHHHGHHDADEVLWLNGITRLDDGVEVSQLAEIMLEQQIGFVVIDTLARCTPGVEENSTKEMGTVVGYLDWLRERTGATPLIVHHSGKDGARGARGSSVLRAAADAELEVTAGMLSVRKMKDAHQEQPTPFILQDSHWSQAIEVATSRALSDALTPTAEQAHAVLETLCVVDAHTVASGEWRQASELPESTFHLAKGQLIGVGKVIQEGTGRAARYRPSRVAQQEADTP